MISIMKQVERAHCIALISWRDAVIERYPELALLHHIPNGGYRDKITAANLKRMGTLAGVFDYCLPVARKGHHGLYLEMKAPGGRLSDSQKRFAGMLQKENYCTNIATDWEQAAKILEWYLKNED